jgi:hypothetical protein
VVSAAWLKLRKQRFYRDEKMQTLRKDRTSKDALWDVSRVFLLRLFRDSIRAGEEDLPEGGKRDAAKY